MRTGGREERKQSTIFSEEEDGGREEEGEEDEGPQRVATLIISLRRTLAAEDLRAPAGPADALSNDHEPAEDDTSWLPGDAMLDPSSSPLCAVKRLLDFYLHFSSSQVVQASSTRDLTRPLHGGERRR